MKTFIVTLLVLFLVSVDTQSTFDYEKFLKTFNLIPEH